MASIPGRAAPGPDPAAADPRPADPLSADLRPAYALPADLRPADPLSADPLSADPRLAAARPIDPLPADLRPADPLPAAARPAQALPADLRPADPLPADPLPADPRPAEPRAAGSLPEPRWLSADERAAWMPFASMLFRLPAALDTQLQRDAGISHFEYMVLASLAQAPGRTLRMSALAELASGSLSRLSHVVSRLETRGWVHRETCPSDGRYTNAILTDEGFRKVADAAPGHVDAVRAFVVDALTGRQLRQLEDISDCINRRL